MRVLFCNIAWMKYYKGDAYGNDHPQGGGSYVVEHQEAHEEFSFHSVELSGGEEIEEGEYCLGFVETKSTNHETDNQLKIEKISGCSLCTREDFVEDVTVVYCARYPWSDKRETVIVGWFRNATVFREYQWVSFEERLGRKNHVQGFNAIARSDNCVLLPVGGNAGRTAGTCLVNPLNTPNTALDSQTSGTPMILRTRISRSS